MKACARNYAAFAHLPSSNAGLGTRISMPMRKTSTIYRQINIEKPVVKITSQDVDDMVKQLARQHATWSTVTHGAQMGNKIVAEYSGWIGENKVIDSGGSPVTIILGSNQLTNKAQKSLIGTRPGETVRTSVKHRKDDTNQSLAGRRVDYEYQVLGVFEGKLPPLDEKLARKLGIKNGSVKSLKKQVRSLIHNQVDTHIRRKIREQIISGLLNTCRIAETGILSNKNSKLDDNEALAEIIIEIVRENRITLDQDKVTAAIEAIAAKSDNPEETASRYHSDQELFSKIEASVLEDQVLEHVLKHARVDAKPISYKKLFQQYPGHFAADLDNSPGQAPTLPVIDLSAETKCRYCVRNCCTYITQKIPAPRSKEDFSHLLWQVSHKDVEAYKDTDGWYLMFRSSCEHLLPTGRCGNYENRMQICRKYSNDYCEFDASVEEGFKLVFKDYDALLRYCKQRFVNWKY